MPRSERVGPGSRSCRSPCTTAGMRARITVADVTLGNNLTIESGRSQLAHRTALLCPGLQQTLKRTYQRRPARTQSGMRARRLCLSSCSHQPTRGATTGWTSTTTRKTFCVARHKQRTAASVPPTKSRTRGGRPARKYEWGAKKLELRGRPPSSSFNTGVLQEQCLMMINNWRPSGFMTQPFPVDVGETD
jgi:hypothetical protein